MRVFAPPHGRRPLLRAHRACATAAAVFPVTCRAQRPSTCLCSGDAGCGPGCLVPPFRGSCSPGWGVARSTTQALGPAQAEGARQVPVSTPRQRSCPAAGSGSRGSPLAGPPWGACGRVPAFLWGSAWPREPHTLSFWSGVDAVSAVAAAVCPWGEGHRDSGCPGPSLSLLWPYRRAETVKLVLLPGLFPCHHRTWAPPPI